MDPLGPGEAAALATAACWTVTALAFEAAGRRVGSLPVNLLRLLVALALHSACGLLFRGRALPTDASREAWGWLSLSGLLGFTFGDLCLFRAFVVIGSRLSLLLMSLVPPLVALMSWTVLREGLSPSDLAGMALTVGGVGLAVGERRRGGRSLYGRVSLGGVALGLAAALGQASGLVLSKLGMGAYSPFGATQIRVLAGIGGFVIVFAAAGLWPRVYAALRDRPAMAQISLGAIFGPFLGVSFSLMAVQLAPAGVAATIMAITPILIIPPAALLFQDRVTPRAILGAALAVGGVAVLLLF